MSIVSFAGHRLIPAPRPSLTKTFLYTPDGTVIGSQWAVTVNGLFLANMGAPTAGSGVNGSYGSQYDLGGYPADENITSDTQNLGYIIRKQENIRELFSSNNNNKLFEVQSADGTPPMKFNFRIEQLSFPEQGPIQWFNTCDYSVQGTAEFLYINGQPQSEDTFDGYISSASETWSVETTEESEGLNLPRTYRLTHSVSAVGRRIYDETGTLVKPTYEQARDYVLPKLGLDSYFTSSSGVKDLPSTYIGFNHLINENIDKLGGEYSVTETWLLASGSALEDFTVNSVNSINDGLVSVTINGTINGLELRDSNQSIVSYKIDNAESKFNSVSGLLFGRAQSYSGYSLNITPTSVTIGKNPVTGVISYDYQFNNRPTNFVSDAKYESIEIIDDFGGSLIAAISVPFRVEGPVLQDIGTKKESTRTLNIELILGPQNTLLVPTSIDSDVATIIDQAAPAGVYQSFLVDNTQAWNPKEGRLSITKTWLYEA